MGRLEDIGACQGYCVFIKSPHECEFCLSQGEIKTKYLTILDEFIKANRTMLEAPEISQNDRRYLRQSLRFLIDSRYESDGSFVWETNDFAMRLPMPKYPAVLHYAPSFGVSTPAQQENSLPAISPMVTRNFLEFFEKDASQYREAKGLKINGNGSAMTMKKENENDDIALGLKEVWDLGRLRELFRPNLGPIQWRTLPMWEMRKRRVLGYTG